MVCVQVSECRLTCYGRGEGLGRRRREDERGRQGKKMEGVKTEGKTGGKTEREEVEGKEA